MKSTDDLLQKEAIMCKLPNQHFLLMNGNGKSMKNVLYALRYSKKNLLGQTTLNREKIALAVVELHWSEGIWSEGICSVGMMKSLQNLQILQLLSSALASLVH